MTTSSAPSNVAGISNAFSKALLSIGPADSSAQSALNSASQIAAGVKDLKQGDFLQIYSNLLLSSAIPKLFDDGNDNNNGNSDDGLSGMGGNFQSLLGSIPGLNTPVNLDISHVEIDGKSGKVVFGDGSSKTVPIQAATAKP